MKYDKLVRDKIPQILKEKGSQIETYVCDDEEYTERLIDKLLEEVSEFLQDDTIEELADVLEVVYAIAAHKKISQQDLEKLRKDKFQKRGGFAEKIVLVEATKVDLNNNT